MTVSIEEMKERVARAEEIDRELRGECRDLSITEVKGQCTYVIVNDGQDRWIAEWSDFDDAVEEIVDRVLMKGYYLDEDEVEYYSDMCCECGCMYSNIGSPSNENRLVKDLLENEESRETILKILEHLGIDEEEVEELLEPAE